MALFEYFPNYIWSLSVSIALENGGQIGREYAHQSFEQLTNCPKRELKTFTATFYHHIRCLARCSNERIRHAPSIH